MTKGFAMRFMPQTYIIVGMALGACAASNPGRTSIAQSISGPGGVTAAAPTVGGVPVAGELVVSWVPDPDAVKYYVLQSADGAPYVDVASVLDPNGGTPPTSWTATGLTDGVQYCYSIVSAHFDGTMSDPGDPGCGTAVGSSGSSRVMHTTKISPLAGQSIGQGAITIQGANFSGVWQPVADGDMLFVPLPVEVGDRIESVGAAVEGADAWGLHLEIRAVDDPAPTAQTTSLGFIDVAPIVADQTASIPIPNGTQTTFEDVTDSNRSYWLQIRANQLSQGVSPAVGTILFITSTAM